MLKSFIRCFKQYRTLWTILILIIFILPIKTLANCDFNTMLVGQVSYANRDRSIWLIEGDNPYRKNNVYNDLAIRYTNDCQLIENKLDWNMSLYGLGYYPYKKTGAFEIDDTRMKLLIDRLSIVDNSSDELHFEFGKIHHKDGVFYFQSPANLMRNYYAGFKSNRIYDNSFSPIYTESFWGGTLSKDAENYSLSLTLAPKLTHVRKWYESSSNRRSLERTNTDNRYLISYTDYRFSENTLGLNVMLGDNQSIALSNSYQYLPKFIINMELAYHLQQNWRHLDTEQVDMLQSYRFPSNLYSIENEQNVELAIGMQYTTDHFSQLGIEYYFQSEGYSSSQWNKQINLVKYLNQDTTPILNKVFDHYKYLMASEINNVTNRGYLLGRHYINTYGSFLMDDGTNVQTYLILNLMDKSSLLGVNYIRPLDLFSQNLDMYLGVNAAIGSRDSEFTLFGQTVNSYLGFKYHF